MNNQPVSSGRGRSKRQQQIYSLPLRKTGSNRSLNTENENGQRERDWNNESGDNSYEWRQQTRKNRKPEQVFYKASDKLDNRGFRLASEPRVLSTNPPNTYPSNHRMNDRHQRDSKSVEPAFIRGGERKPPSGRRDSKQGAANFLTNIEHLAPRLQKKWLEDNGLPSDYLETMSRNNLNNSNYSQTLPLSPRARGGQNINRGDRNRYSTHYQGGYQNDARSRTPVDHYRQRSRSTDNYDETSDTSNRYNHGNFIDNGVQLGGDGLDVIRPYANIDWAEDVEKEVAENDFENNRNSNRNRHRRNRSSSRCVDSKTYYQHNDDRNFKVPYPKTSTQSNRNRKNSQSSNQSRENSMERQFINRRGGGGGRQQGQNYQQRERSNERFSDDRYLNRENSLERQQDWQDRNWRELDENGSKIAEMTKQFEKSLDIHANNARGIIFLPSKDTDAVNVPLDNKKDKPAISQSVKNCLDMSTSRILFDPKNPEKPIVVPPQMQTRNYVPPDNLSELTYPQYQKQALQDQRSSGPVRYNKMSETYKTLHNPKLINDLEHYDAQLQAIIAQGNLLIEWDIYLNIRTNAQRILQQLLAKDIKFCQKENVEHHFWKFLYYNIIELLKKSFAEQNDPNHRVYYKEKVMEIIENGAIFFESLLGHLEQSYKFSLDKYIGINSGIQTGQKFVGLALVSAQKFFLFLGDLARYKEQINETSNYGKAKQWYVKAQQVQPKNGRPYNQLALLSVYSKRKIDAVYFYMRSLMSSNAFQSARESLMDLFNETKKKYESTQRKREEKNRLRLKEKEHRFDGHLRKETWICEGESRVHRTAPLDPLPGHGGDTSEEEELKQLDAIDLNKRFIVSFLHVQGKLNTKTGMESFTQCAIQMLREFRALIQNPQIAVTSHRLLQLMSLNMFAIHNTQLKDSNLAPGTRSEVQECALSIGLLMFGIILERFIYVIKEALNSSSSTKINQKPQSSSSSLLKDLSKNSCGEQVKEKKKIILLEDAKVMLPAIKVWCDWMLLHKNIWNPPPFCLDYKIGVLANHDPWKGLSNLMTLLEKLDTNKDVLSTEEKPDYEIVRLQEDITLAGFIPLMENEMQPVYSHCNEDVEEAQNSLRIQKIIFFGTVLCTCNPPVLKKVNNESDDTEYISIVQNRTDGSSDSEILLESFSDEDESENGTATNNTGHNNDAVNELSDIIKNSDKNCEKMNESASEIRRLLRRKDELLRKQKMQEKYTQRLQDILSQSTVALCMEVRPKYLVPDTNCFVDYLTEIKAIANAHPLYQLMVPIVVINELEGLTRGGKSASQTNSLPVALAQGLAVFPDKINSSILGRYHDPVHAAKVAEASKRALQFIKSKQPSVKCVTTKGSILTSFAFTSENDVGELKSNDDKILETALNLCKNSTEEKRGEVRFILREVVLLTTDRNLRVKAISNDLPVRDMPDFIKWSGLSLSSS